LWRYDDYQNINAISTNTKELPKDGISIIPWPKYPSIQLLTFTSNNRYWIHIHVGRDEMKRQSIKQLQLDGTLMIKNKNYNSPFFYSQRIAIISVATKVKAFGDFLDLIDKILELCSGRPVGSHDVCTPYIKGHGRNGRSVRRISYPNL
jgi:hypothetical protein